MNATHTPGKLVAHDRHVVAVGCGTIGANGYQDHVICDRVDGRGLDEARANAKRIALAWNSHDELLAACIQARYLISDLDPHGLNTGTYDQLTNAIARATGRKE